MIDRQRQPLWTIPVVSIPPLVTQTLFEAKGTDLKTGQSEHLPFVKDYYSHEDIHPNDKVSVLWAYQPRAGDEFELQKGDMLHIVGLWDDGWATGTRFFVQAEEYDPAVHESLDPNSDDIKAFPLVCVCKPKAFKMRVAAGAGSMLLERWSMLREESLAMPYKRHHSMATRSWCRCSSTLGQTSMLPYSSSRASTVAVCTKVLPTRFARSAHGMLSSKPRLESSVSVRSPILVIALSSIAIRSVVAVLGIASSGSPSCMHLRRILSRLRHWKCKYRSFTSDLGRIRDADVSNRY